MDEKLTTFLEDDNWWKWLISDIWTKVNYRILGDNFQKEELGILLDISDKIKTLLFIENNPEFISFSKKIGWKNISLFSYDFKRKLIIDYKEIKIPKYMWNIFNVIEVDWKLLFLAWDRWRSDIVIYKWNIDPHSYNPDYNLGCYYLLDENLCWSDKISFPYISETYEKDITHYESWKNISINGINILSFHYWTYNEIFVIDKDANFKVINKEIEKINKLDNWEIEFIINWRTYKFSEETLDFVLK